MWKNNNNVISTDVDIDHYIPMCEGGEGLGFRISNSWQPAVVKKYSGRKGEW